MTYTNVLQAPRRFQFETNSGSLYLSQVYNCGPTSMTMIAGYYRDAYYGIEATRRLSAAPGSATNAWQQRDMLRARGVAAEVHLPFTDTNQIHSIVDNGRRPIGVGMRMDLVPSWVRDHSFTGWHAMVIMAGAYQNGVRGFWVNDPNFSPIGGIRPDPDRGTKWYPDLVIDRVISGGGMGYCVVPSGSKPIPTSTLPKGRGHVATPSGTNVCNIRKSASYTGTVYARARSDGYTHRASDNVRLWSNGSRYIFNGWVNSDWASCNTGGGMRLYIHRAVFIVDVAP